MFYYFKLIFIAILIYLMMSIIQENFQQDFSLPKVKVHQVKKEQNKIFNPEKTLETGKGLHDRIRFEGKWN